MDEPIKMQVRVLTHVSPKNHVLDGGHASCAETGALIKIPFGS